jgi:uncharacterized membrane protein SpoIIM required for sporulation
MMDEKLREQVQRLQMLLKKPAVEKTEDDLLQMASLYRNLSAVLPELRSSIIRLEVERVVLMAHRYLSARKTPTKSFGEYVFRIWPASVFRSPYVRICTALFYLTFFTALITGYHSRSAAVSVIGEATLSQYEEMHSSGDQRFTTSMGFSTGFYIMNNLTLNLMVYGTGLLAGVGSVLLMLYNAVFLGTTIGYLLQSGARDGILNWIFGHAPFELTAIGMSAGAGLQTGLAFLNPGSRSRLHAMSQEGRRALPALLAALVLTLLAAFIEGFLAPSGIPRMIKMAVGAFSALFIILYFIVPSLRAGERTIESS